MDAVSWWCYHFIDCVCSAVARLQQHRLHPARSVRSHSCLVGGFLDARLRLVELLILSISPYNNPPARRSDVDCRNALNLPAIVINSFIHQVLSFAHGGQASATLVENITVIVSAPVGEELCKALAVFSLAGLIDSKKRGFQVGFTVGLGFALLENLQYILFSLFAGEVMAFSYGLTTVVRGIGSIPGHAMWTACSGYAIGHMLEQRKQPHRIPDVKQWNLVNPLNPSTSRFEPSFTSDSSFFSKSSDLQLPTSLPVMLGIAMFGHAFWNGSSVLMSYMSGNLDPVVGLIAELTWIVVLIALLWTFGRFVLAAAMEDDA